MMSKEKKMSDGETMKKTGRLKKIAIIVVGILVIFFLIGVFSEDDTQPQQTEKTSEAGEVVADERYSDKAALENGEDTQTDVSEEKTDDDEDAESRNENGIDQNNSQPNEIDEYIYSISEYTFQDEKNGKKIAELYGNALDADRDEFIYVIEEEKVHLLSNSETCYKKSLDTDHARFRYYGDVNKDGEPDGMGMLTRNWEELNRNIDDIQRWTRMFMDGEEYYEQEKENVCVEIVYIGGFKDGFKEGYGIDFGAAGIYDFPIIDYEGEFEHGRKDGNGTDYLGLAGGSYDETYNDMMMEAYFVEYSETAGNGLWFPAVVKSNLYFEGTYKEGERDGEGKEYYILKNENSEPCLHYEGGFKNSHYSGNGTLYFEDGTVWYKGEFKNGRYDGKGILYDEQGKIQHEGKFKDGEIE